MRRAKKNVEDVGFNITPLIDMTFLLLIFFMVTSKLSKEKLKLDIKLPIAASAITPKDLSNRDILNIDAEGLFYVSDREVTTDEMKDYLAERFRHSPPLRLYVRADSQTRAAKIRELIQMATQAGAVDIIFGSLQK